MPSTASKPISCIRLNESCFFFVCLFQLLFSLVLSSTEIWISSKYSVYNGCFVPCAVYWENALIIHLLFISDLQQLLVFETVTFMCSLQLQHKCHVLLKTSCLFVPISTDLMKLVLASLHSHTSMCKIVFTVQKSQPPQMGFNI